MIATKVREGQTLWQLLPALVSENPIADRHREVRGVDAVPQFNVTFYVRQPLLCLRDVT